VLWPLVAARVASIGLLLILIVVTSPFRGRPTATGLPVIILAGICDSGGNAFFALAAQTGRLDVAAILSSLYPAATIALAWLILKERLLPQQWAGVVAALIAILLISI
jgi:drug/metabolite transporter (DMT)-like permease